MYSTIKLLLHIFFLFVACINVRADVDGNRVFRQITAADGIADNSAQTIKCTDSGRMTITTLGNINFYDGSRFSYVSTEGEEVYPLADYHGHYHLYYDAYHHLWLKSSKGVSCVDLLVERYVGNVDSLFALFGAKGPVDDVFIDSRGEVWLCQDGYVFCAKHGWKRPLPTASGAVTATAAVHSPCSKANGCRKSGRIWNRRNKRSIYAKRQVGISVS